MILSSKSIIKKYQVLSNGVGISKENPDIYNPAKWRGQNLLGKALMEVRKQLAN